MPGALVSEGSRRVRESRAGLGAAAARAAVASRRHDVRLSPGAGDGPSLRIAAAVDGAEERYAEGLTWARRGEALLAVLLLPGAAGTVARAARLVGARERDYRRWLLAAREWCAFVSTSLDHRAELPKDVPSVIRDDAVRARLLAFLDAARETIRAGGAS